ncbi:MAG TPA: glycoside hydrolase family 57 protein [Syntrophales bacterium]
MCFHAHLPLQLKKYSFFDIGRSHDYVDEEQNRQTLERVVKSCYLPANKIVLGLIRRTRGRFRVAYSISGMLLEQLERGEKDVLTSFQRLADTGSVEFLSEPYHHSLASLFSEDEFRAQVALQRRKVRALFGQVPRAFRNTGLMYGNDVARIAESMGFRTILAGGAGRLAGCDATATWRPVGCRKLTVLFGHDRLSGDIPCGDGGGAENGQALRADEYARRMAGEYQGKEMINLFVDYETFGGHYRNDTGILDFLEAFPAILLRHRNWRFLTPSDAAADHEPKDKIDVPRHISRADSGKEGTTWLENHMQKDAAHTVYALEAKVRETKNRQRIGVWRNLQASEHFCHMKTKGLSDGAHHRAFQPFASPYDAYISYMNILKDFSGRLAGKTGVRS